MIARIEFSYQSLELLAKKAAEDPAVYDVLRDIFPNAPKPEDAGKYYNWERDTLIDLDTDGPRLTALGLTFEVKNFKGTLPLTAILPETKAPVTVYVQVPHVGLLAVDEVEVREDYCTDRLQQDLDNGWRILCVCPPNAARRPDYILGRTKERRS